MIEIAGSVGVQNVRAQSAVTAACAERGHSRGVSRGVGCAFVFDGVRSISLNTDTGLLPGWAPTSGPMASSRGRRGGIAHTKTAPLAPRGVWNPIFERAPAAAVGSL